MYASGIFDNVLRIVSGLMPVMTDISATVYPSLPGDRSNARIFGALVGFTLVLALFTAGMIGVLAIRMCGQPLRISALCQSLRFQFLGINIVVPYEVVMHISTLDELLPDRAQ